MTAVTQEYDPDHSLFGESREFRVDGSELRAESREESVGGKALATRPRRNPRMMRGGDALNVMVWGKRVGNFVP
jgi:hypothetical protein